MNAANEETSPYERHYQPAAFAVFALGLGLQLFLNARAWVGGDQIHLLALGLDFADDGVIRSFAKYHAGGGGTPGALLQFLVGVPLAICGYFRSPLVVVALFHIGAGILLWRLMREAKGDRFAFWFMLIYWLSPWRLYNAGFLWEPSFIFLPAALHFWAGWRSREKAAFIPSAVMAFSLCAALQIHNSFFVLVLLSGLLFWQKHIRLHWKGIIVGSACGSITLIPIFLEIFSGTLPAFNEAEGFIGASLLKVLPVLKGALYYFRLPTLDIGTPLQETVFLNADWTTAHPEWAFLEFGIRILQGVGVATILLSLYASFTYFIPLRRKAEQPDVPGAWLRIYSWYTFLALTIAAALSPITLQSWMVVIVLPAACLPLTAWFCETWKTSTARRIQAASALALCQISIMTLVGIGKPIFRPGHINDVVAPHERPELKRLFPE